MIHSHQSATLTVVLPFHHGGEPLSAYFWRQLEFFHRSDIVKRIFVPYQNTKPVMPEGKQGAKVLFFPVDSWFSGDSIRQCLDTPDDYILLLLPPLLDLEFEPHALEYFVEVAGATASGLLYSDFRQELDKDLIERPASDYQIGSMRENFDFGHMVLLSREAAITSLNYHGEVESSLRWAGFYDLRLKISTDFPIRRIPEPLYKLKAVSQQVASALKEESQKNLDLLNPNHPEHQAETETVANQHLKRVGAYLSARVAPLPPPEGDYPVLASIIIPVRDRERTIAEAVHSALVQKTSFSYNVIVVDDRSTDRTTEILQKLARQHSNLVHLTPVRTDLGIGGLWNEAIYSPHCGAYAVQLDSDDVYAHESVLEKLICKFAELPPGSGAQLSSGVPLYAMVIGTFTYVDFNLKEVAPGLTMHREISQENGRNNALRVDGLGAPRAYYLPVLRRFGLPNVSYGEDYAICLRISREYAIGRIFESLYLARQWDGNTGRSMPLGSIKSINLKNTLPHGVMDEKSFMALLRPLTLPLLAASKNRYNGYKDWLRSIEIHARRKLNEQFKHQ